MIVAQEFENTRCCCAKSCNAPGHAANRCSCLTIEKLWTYSTSCSSIRNGHVSPWFQEDNSVIVIELNQSTTRSGRIQWKTRSRIYHSNWCAIKCRGGQETRTRNAQGR